MNLAENKAVDGALHRFAAVVLIATATLIFPIRNAEPINTPELKADANETAVGSSTAAAQASIAAGDAHTCALSAGAVKCWGYNVFGQLGDGTTTNSSTPVGVLGGLSFGPDTTSPTLSAAAVNSAGKQLILQFDEQISSTTASASNFAVTVAGASRSVSSVAVTGSTVVLTLASAVSPGQSVSVAYTAPSSDSSTSNAAIQDSSGNDAASFDTSSGAVTVANHHVAAQQYIAAGSNHTCALSSGAVICWGRNDYGQLGDSTNTTRSTPVGVSGLSSGVTAITAGLYHTCALSSGAVKCWGYNLYGQLGDGDTVQRTTPVDVRSSASVSTALGDVTAITAGKYHTCALLSSGEVKCWGDKELLPHIGHKSTIHILLCFLRTDNTILVAS